MAAKLSLRERYGSEIEALKTADGLANVVHENFLGEGFSGLLDQREEIATLITELEAEKELLSSQVAEWLIKRGYLGSNGVHRKVSIVTTNRPTINKTKLVENGVSPKLIEACTDKSVSYSLRVSKVEGEL